MKQPRILLVLIIMSISCSVEIVLQSTIYYHYSQSDVLENESNVTNVKGNWQTRVISQKSWSINWSVKQNSLRIRNICQRQLCPKFFFLRKYHECRLHMIQLSLWIWYYTTLGKPWLHDCLRTLHTCQCHKLYPHRLLTQSDRKY